jgi:hypothetical protein
MHGNPESEQWQNWLKQPEIGDLNPIAGKFRERADDRDKAKLLTTRKSGEVR